MVLAQDLRDAVLQAALQGKLTKQLETDSSVDEMLENIKEEKKQLIKEKKIKKEKALPSIEKDDNPFEIPNNWQWIRLAEIGEIIGGGTPKTTESAYWDNGNISWITPADMNGCGMFIGKGSKSITEKGLNNSSAQLIPKDSVIISTRAPIGYIAIAENELSTSQGCKTFSAYNKTKISSKYIYFVIINSISDLTKRASGTTFKEISGRGVGETIIPLPPIEEQQRIVDRVNELMEKIDEYEKVEKELIVLEQKFPDDMKNALLQAAMQGKLTEHLDSDSSVDELIDKCCKDKKKAIEEGKYRKERYRGAIENSEFLPCKIPENWRWVYISDMALFQEGPGILAKDFRDSGVPLIRIAGMRSDKVSLEGCNYLDENMVKDKWNHFKLDLGDIVISTSASMDKIAEVQKDTVNAILYTGLIRFKMYGNINKEYFKYFIKSPFYLHQIDEQKAGGTIKHYGPSHLKKMIIPLPPIEEQQRIVEQLEKLLPLCETL